MTWTRNLLKWLILLVTAYAVAMLLHWPIGFTMFTQLSNLFAATATLLQLTARTSGRRARLAAWKYSATVSVFITFLIYLVALGPMEPGGLLAAYRQDHWASLCLHVITPALCVADFLINDAPARRWDRRLVKLAVLPPLGYFGLVLILGACGVRWFRGMSAPYAFLNYDAPAGWFGFMPETASHTTLGVGVFYMFLLLLALFIATGAGLLRLARRRRRGEN